MVFLGFADDVLDIRWRFKMPLPAIAAIPLLMVYWVNIGETHIMIPIPLRPLIGQLIDLGKPRFQPRFLMSHWSTVLTNMLQNSII